MFDKAFGLRVIGVDVLAERVALAVECGADAAIIGAEQADGPAAMREFSTVPGAGWVEGVDCVIETSGAATARECILPSLRRLGKAAIVGVGSDEKVINPSHIHGRAATILGSVVFPLGWSWDLARFLAASGTSFEPAVTHRFSLDEAEEALRTADEGIGGKVLFVP